MSGRLSVGAVVGVTIGSTLGFFLFLFVIYKLIQCCLRRRKANFGPQFDLEQPFTQSGDLKNSWRSRSGKMPTIKESELVTSPNVAVQLDPLDMLAMNGLPVSHGPNGKTLTADVTKQVPGGGGGPTSILRWLESAEVPGPNDAVGVQPKRNLNHSISLPNQPGQPGILENKMRSLSARLNALSMRAITDRFSAGDIADMRKKLLAAGLGGGSSSEPLDLKGIVFNRLPPSRRASPAPSTVEGSIIMRTPRRNRHMEGDGPFDFEQASSASYHPSPLVQPGSAGRNQPGTPQSGLPFSRSLPREGSPAVPMGSQGGSRYVAIGSLARNSLKRNAQADGAAEQATGLPPRAPRASSLRESSPRAVPQSPSVQGVAVASSQEEYQQALQVLQAAAGGADTEDGEQVMNPMHQVPKNDGLL